MDDKRATDPYARLAASMWFLSSQEVTELAEIAEDFAAQRARRGFKPPSEIH